LRTKLLKGKSSPFCASVLLITMWGPLMWTLPKFRMFRIFLNINSISYSFRSIANQNCVRYSDSTSYFKKYSSSKCKQTVCLHYGLDFPFNKFFTSDILYWNATHQAQNSHCTMLSAKQVSRNIKVSQIPKCRLCFMGVVQTQLPSHKTEHFRDFNRSC
jgi:hypothetical protein